MPNITEYEPGNLAIRPSETGPEAAAAAGRRINAFYTQAAQGQKEVGARLGAAVDTAVNYQTHHQINAGADNASNLFIDATQSLNQAMANAPTHQGRAAFDQWRNEYLEPKLQQFVNSGFFTTPESQNWANQTVNHYRQHFFVQGQSEVMRKAKDDIGVSVDNQNNNFRNAAFLNPAGAFDIIKQIDGNMQATLAANPDVTGVDAANFRDNVTQKMKKEVANAAIMGAISKGGDWQKLAADPRLKGLVDDTEMAKYERQDRFYTRLADTEQKHLTAQNLADAKAASSKEEKGILTSMIPTNGSAPPTPGELRDRISKWGQTDGTPVSQLSKMMKTYDHYVKHLNDPDPITDKANYDNYFGRLTDAKNPLTVNDVVEDPGLSKHSKQALVWSIKQLDSAAMQNPQFKYATEQVRANLAGGSPVAKLHNAGKFAEFMEDFLPRYLNDSKANKLLPNALDLRDPDSLISQTLRSHTPNLGETIQQNGGIGAPLKTGPIAPPVTNVPQASM